MKGRTAMKIDVLDYYSKEEWSAFKAESAKHETPFLMVNLGIIKKKYSELTSFFPFAKIYYAVKSNPAKEVLTLLRDLGSNFDVASRYELDDLLSLGVSPDRISYGNTIKKAADIKYFYDNGVRLFATDSETDLRNIGKCAPGSRIFCRILTDGSETADWPGNGMELLKKLGFRTAAMALSDNSVSIDDPGLMAEEKLAILMGSEGDGLTEQTIANCDYTVKIPMYHDVDSLNVAAASAVAFWQLRRKENN
jgi:diaminopimelate decarboxylase